MALTSLVNSYMYILHIAYGKTRTLTGGNFDEFGKSESNHQTLTFQS